MSDDKGKGNGEDPKVRFTIDGDEVTARPGQTVLEAGMDNGVFIPHYCWHPALSISGNCRMCLVHQKGAPKPIIACQTEVRAGMEIEAFSDEAKKTREGVMELLLINHPLDCPVCDQAGECDLQEFSYQYGNGQSRFVDAKNQKPNKDLGELVRFNGNRCIVCTRCVRFCEEITGTAELTTRERGDHNYIDTFPGYPLDNPLSLCTTDLCPVGALLDRDFIHKARVWNLTPTKSVCGGCASGCNITAQTWNDKVQRIVPRENQMVNKFWMCDEGRLLYHSAQREDRVLECSVLDKKDTRKAIDFDSGIDLLVENWKGAREVHGDKGVGVILSGWATLEEAAAALTLLRGQKEPKLGADGLLLATAFAGPGVGWAARDGFTIHADKNPNRAGLERVLGAELAKGMHNGFAAIEQGIKDKSLQVLVVIDGLPDRELTLPAGFEELLEKVPFLVVFESRGDSVFADKADLRFPAASWLEKDGTFVNIDGRVQRVRPATLPPSGLRWELEVLQEAARRLGVVERVVSAGSIFRRLAKAEGSPFAGLGYNDLGDYGLNLERREDPVRPSSGYGVGPVSRNQYLDSSVAEMIRVSVHRGG